MQSQGHVSNQVLEADPDFCDFMKSEVGNTFQLLGTGLYPRAPQPTAGRSFLSVEGEGNFPLIFPFCCQTLCSALSWENLNLKVFFFLLRGPWEAEARNSYSMSFLYSCFQSDTSKCGLSSEVKRMRPMERDLSTLAPSVWNLLPTETCSVLSLSTFRNQEKHGFFS